MKKNILYAIGNNCYGQLGNGNTKDIDILRDIKCESGYFTHLEFGSGHTLASTSTNKLFSFGRNVEGQLGLEDYYDRTVPREIKLPNEEEKFRKTTDKEEKVTFDYFWCGDNQSFILSTSGFVYCCGDNFYHGSLAIGDDLKKIKQIS